METPTKPVKTHSTRKTGPMHKYVLICIGVWLVFVGTFPLAYLRVSRSEKYGGTPFNSLGWQEPQKATPLSQR